MQCVHSQVRLALMLTMSPALSVMRAGSRSSLNCLSVLDNALFAIVPQLTLFLVSALSVTPPIATATGLGFHASSSCGLLRGLTWSHGPYHLMVLTALVSTRPPQVAPQQTLPQIGPPSWLEFLLPWLNSINSWSPTYLLSPPCPLLTWSPLVFLKPTHARLFTAWSPTKR